MRRMKRALGACLAVVALLGACSRGEEAAEPEPETRPYGGADARPAPAAWMVSPEGAGPVRIGMTLSELAPYLAADADTAAIEAGCAYVEVTDAPPGLGFMVEGRRLVRVEVREGTTATAEGVQLGDAEARVREVYPGLRRMPHKYTDGAYLVVVPGTAPDTLARYVFETDGRRVVQYRAGVAPAVEYVEGCS